VTEQRIKVEVAYATQREQALLEIEAEKGVTVRDAIERSGLLGRFPEVDLNVNKVGIHGKVARLDQILETGDRVEIYRPLIADPKEARKRRAADSGSQGSTSTDAPSA